MYAIGQLYLNVFVIYGEALSKVSKSPYTIMQMHISYPKTTLTPFFSQKARY